METRSSSKEKRVTRHFKELMDEEQYRMVIKVGDNMQDDDLLKHLWQVMTTMDRFECHLNIWSCRMLAGFLAHGSMTLSKEQSVNLTTLLLIATIEDAWELQSFYLSMKTAMTVPLTFLRLCKECMQKRMNRSYWQGKRPSLKHFYMVC